jgi:formylglycine-generating enzyme required for sulfatase activity
MPRSVTAAALVAAMLLLPGLVPHAWAGPPAPPGPFMTVSPEFCGACHGPGHAPDTNTAKKPCKACHEAPHAAGMEDAAPATDPGPGATPPEKVDLTGMVYVPAGPAIIGNDGREITEGKGNLDETPQHTVTLQAFYIDKYEVTNARYKRFTDATGHPVPRHWKGGVIPEGKENHPVVYVNWFDADAFCRWEGKRLPDELEWEKAARGPDGTVFPWGNRFGLDKANTPQRWASLHESGGTMPVGSFPAGKSYYGAYDMAGNVWEWTQNWYLPYPGNQFPNSFYGHKNKVLKGGSWYDCLSYGCGLSAPSYNRSRFTPKIRNNSFGFRCAATPPPGSTPPAAPAAEAPQAAPKKEAP